MDIKIKCKNCKYRSWVPFSAMIDLDFCKYRERIIDNQEMYKSTNCVNYERKWWRILAPKIPPAIEATTRDAVSPVRRLTL